jgi:putative transcriptional regulator
LYIIKKFKGFLNLVEKCFNRGERQVLENRLDELIKEQGLKKGYIAKQVGVSPQTISSWVSDKSRPQLEQAIVLAKVLGVSIEDIWEVVENGE